MIYTITFNPSLDYVLKVNKFDEGKINIADSEEIFAGGKGINVSIMLRNLGVENKAFGFIAGFTGDEIEKQVKESGCMTEFIKLKTGSSRINVKLKSKKESEINSKGPNISDKDIEELYKKLECLNDGDILVLAGSVPSSIKETIYEDILNYLGNKKVKVIVDTTKNLLVNVLKYKPFLIKPNNYELEEIFNVKLISKEEIIKYAKKLQSMGALNVLISLAKDGAILINEHGEVLEAKAPSGEVKNSVGAGDSMVAGFLAGFLKENDYNYALKLGIAAGSATAFSDGLAKSEKIKEIFLGIK